MGKKKDEWVTRKQRRDENDRNPLLCLYRILAHFFAEFEEWIEELEDPRNKSYIVYSQYHLIFVAILKNICSIMSMRSMTENFNDDICIQNLSQLTGDPDLQEIPHYDTVNYYLGKLSPQNLATVRTEMIKALIRSKVFDNARLCDKFWRIIIDGTGLAYFKEKHCENCLRDEYTTEDGKKRVRYYHKVLEAKLVLADNIVISIDSEFIENEHEDVSKQDCEINAAKRLIERLKKTFPRLRICLQGDALYEAETIMELASKNSWKYLLTHKDARQLLVGEAYELLDNTDKEKVINIGPEKGTGYFYNNVEKLVDKKQVMNIVEYVYKQDDTEYHMYWVTNINMTKAKTEKVITAGRGRWMIENEGFNKQKNVLYYIEHLNSRNYTAMKNHYLITQIADIIMQLYLAWNSAHKTVMESISNAASWILESFRKQVITAEDSAWAHQRTSLYLQ